MLQKARLHNAASGHGLLCCCQSWRGSWNSCHLTSCNPSRFHCSACHSLPQLFQPSSSHIQLPAKDRLLSSRTFSKYRGRVPELQYTNRHLHASRPGRGTTQCGKNKGTICAWFGIWQRKLACHMAITGLAGALLVTEPQQD